MPETGDGGRMEEGMEEGMQGNREEGKLGKERERKGITDQTEGQEEEEDSPLPHLQTQHVLKTQFST